MDRIPLQCECPDNSRPSPGVDHFGACRYFASTPESPSKISANSRRHGNVYFHLSFLLLTCPHERREFQPKICYRRNFTASMNRDVLSCQTPGMWERRYICNISDSKRSQRLRQDSLFRADFQMAPFPATKCSRTFEVIASNAAAC